MPFSPQVAVEQQARLLFTELGARIDPVLLARLIAGLVAVAVLHIGYRLILLGDAGDHLFVKLFAQGLGRLEHCLGIGVLGLEIVQHLGLLPLVVTQPVVVVDAGIPVFFQSAGMFGGHGRLDWMFACQHGGLFIGISGGENCQKG